MDLRKKIFSYSGFVILLTIIFLAITYQRLYFSVDFSDESFYVALSYRFALGDSFFIDELNPAQSFSILTFPFVKLYLWLMGSADSIVLFMRHLYFVFALLVAGSIFLVLRNIFKWQTALIISSATALFFPFNIPNLSYNTLGGGLFTAGCFFGLWLIWNRKNPYYLFISGLLHGLAIISYPTLLIPSALFILILLFLSPVKKMPAFLGFCTGGALVALLLLLPLFIRAGTANLKAVFDHAVLIREANRGAGATYQISKVVSNLYHHYPNKVLSLSVLTGMFIGFKIKPVFFKYILLLIPLLPVSLSGLDWVGNSLVYISHYGLLAFCFIFLLKDNKFAKQLFYYVWIPSFIAGMTVAWTSGNGFIMAGIGLFPASIITTVFLVILFKKYLLENSLIDSKLDMRLRHITNFRILGKSLKLLISGFSRFLNYKRLYITVPILILSILVIFQYSAVFRDDKITELNTRIKFGPYKGLYTTREKKEYLYDLSSDLALVTQPDKKILFYNDFATGFLLTPMSPATNTVWLHPTINRQSIINYYQKNNAEPDIAVRMKEILWKNTTWKLNHPKNDPVDNLITSSEYEKIVSKKNYDIYQKIDN